jgi:hypothetical protein
MSHTSSVELMESAQKLEIALKGIVDDLESYRSSKYKHDADRFLAKLIPYINLYSNALHIDHSRTNASHAISHLNPILSELSTFELRSDFHFQCRGVDNLERYFELSSIFREIKYQGVELE